MKKLSIIAIAVLVGSIIILLIPIRSPRDQVLHKMDTISKAYSKPCIPASKDCLDDREALRQEFFIPLTEYAHMIELPGEDLSEISAISERMEAAFQRHKRARESLDEQ